MGRNLRVILELGLPLARHFASINSLLYSQKSHDGNVLSALVLHLGKLRQASVTCPRIHNRQVSEPGYNPRSHTSDSRDC